MSHQAALLKEKATTNTNKCQVEQSYGTRTRSDFSLPTLIFHRYIVMMIVPCLCDVVILPFIITRYQPVGRKVLPAMVVLQSTVIS